MLARAISIAIGLSLLLSTPLLAQCRILESKDPAAAEIISAAGAFLEKLARGDSHGAKELCAGPQDQLELIDIYARWMAVSKQLSQAVESRFPPQKEFGVFQLPLSALALRFQSLSSCYVAVLDDRASISGSGLFTDPGLCLRRVDNRWRVTHLVAAEQRTLPLKRTLTAMIDCFEGTAKQLQSGKLTSVKDALDEFAKQFLPALNQWADAAPWGRPGTTLPVQPPPNALRINADLITLLGQDRRSDPITSLIAAIPALPYMDHSKSALFLYSRETGIRLHFRREDNRLFYIEVSAAGQGCNQYPGELPHGLSFADTRRDVERKLGRPPESLGGVQGRYSAYYTRLDLAIHYTKAAPRDPDNTIASVALAIRDPEDHLPLSPTGPAFAMRLIADKPNPSAEVLPDPDDPTGRATISVLPEILLDANSIAEIFPFPVKTDPSKFSIDFRMTPEGARRLQQISTQYVGRRLAVIADGRVIMAPTIRGPLSNDVEIAPQPGGKEDFYRLACRIHAAVFTLPPAPTTRQSDQMSPTIP